MPAFVKSKSDEHIWERAKVHAGKKGGEQNWALTNYIYQKAKKSKEKK